MAEDGAQKCIQSCCTYIAWTIAFVSTTALIVLTIMMDHKNCIDTPLNTTYLFSSPEERQ